jgi:hypothetical protein
VQTIRHANRGEQIPIFAMGVGFDANMDLLKDITDRTPGKKRRTTFIFSFVRNSVSF